MEDTELAFQIRTAKDDDSEAVGELCRRSNRPVWKPEALASGEHRVVYVAQVGARVVAAAKTHWHQRAEGVAPAGHYLGGIIVEPTWRRRGIGHALTASRLQWVWERSHAAYYFTNETNQASLALHAAFGFQPIAAATTIRSVNADDGTSKLLLLEAKNPLLVSRVTEAT